MVKPITLLVNFLAVLCLLGTDARAGAGDVGPFSPVPGLWQPTAVFGTDDRVVVPPRMKADEAKLGVIFNARSLLVCTAFCVAPNVVATAAHCLFRTASEQFPRLEDYRFAPNYNRQNESVRIAGYQSNSMLQNIAVGNLRPRTQPPIDAASDWALVRLAAPVCRAGVFALRPLAIDELIRESRAGRIFQLSFHRDFSDWRLAYSQPCLIDRDYETSSWATMARDFSSPEEVILHRCDTGGVSSGSPLLVEAPDGRFVVGFNSGTYDVSRSEIQVGQVHHRYKSETIANTGGTIRALAEVLPYFRQTRMVPTGPAMTDLQDRLRELGHYAGLRDGVFGHSMRAAIEAFEKAEGRRVYGLPSEDLARLIEARTGRPLPIRVPERPPGPVAQPPSAPPPSFSPPRFQRPSSNAP